MPVCAAAHHMHRDVSLCHARWIKCGSVFASMYAQVCVGRVYTQLCVRLHTATCRVSAHVSHIYLCGSRCVCGGGGGCNQLLWWKLYAQLCAVSPQVCISYTQYVGADKHRCVYVAVPSACKVSDCVYYLYIAVCVPTWWSGGVCPNLRGSYVVDGRPESVSGWLR